MTLKEALDIAKEEGNEVAFPMTCRIGFNGGWNVEFDVWSYKELERDWNIECEEWDKAGLNIKPEDIEWISILDFQRERKLRCSMEPIDGELIKTGLERGVIKAKPDHDVLEIEIGKRSFELYECSDDDDYDWNNYIDDVRNGTISIDHLADKIWDYFEFYERSDAGYGNFYDWLYYKDYLKKACNE